MFYLHVLVPILNASQIKSNIEEIHSCKSSIQGNYSIAIALLEANQPVIYQ